MNIKKACLQLIFALLYVSTSVAQNDIKKEYYANGNLQKEIPYADGKINGIAKLYYESGELQKETSFIEGKMQKMVF